MPRGQSPYQGRYTVPTVDFSPITQGGAAWGEAFKGVGESIGAGIEKYGLKKKDQQAKKGRIKNIVNLLDDLEKQNPEHAGQYAIQREQLLDEDIPLGVRDAQSQGLLKTIGISGQMRQLEVQNQLLEETKGFKVELARLAKENAELREKKAATAQTFLDKKQMALADALKDRAEWMKSGSATPAEASRLWLEEQPDDVRRLIANMEPIQAGTYSPMTEEAAKKQKYTTAFLKGNLDTLGRRQKLEERELTRREAVDKARPIAKTVEEEEAQKAAQLATARAVPGQLEVAGEISEEKLKSAQWMNSEEARKMSKEDRDLNRRRVESLIAAQKASSAIAQQKMYALMNPSDSKLAEANDKALNDAFTRRVYWEDEDGNKASGTYEDWLERSGLDDDLVPSQGILDNEAKIKGLWFQQEQIGGRNRVMIDDSPAQQAAQGAVEGETRGAPSFEEWKRSGHAFGFKDESYSEYVNEMKAKGFQRDQIAPPPLDEIDYR